MEIALIIFTTFLILSVSGIVFLLAFSFMSGFKSYQSDDGFSDFVDSARWIDNK